ncbi:hypothetical protein DPEC_G00350050 [Dallia pectoralis]|uniref:Uncharacterized protein n=1 Tax=Dallia pectoralis TaxID=75939 RepID=A0ACC2F1K7_DALPE|nr:hypothetical protein DPEC_G00350050 [Dallia pectoralis]
MEQAFPSLSTSSPIEPSPEEFQLRVEFFRKLGYSRMEVQSALMKTGLGTDTNSVLEELVHSGVSTVTCASSSPESDEDATSHKGLSQSSWNQALPIDSPVTSLEDRRDTDCGLKPIVIDGSNVAMSHGNKEVFSCRGIMLAVNYFLDRGHSTITVFVPSWRKEQPRPDVPITERNLLLELEKKKIVVFTPSRRVGGKRVVCYDDRFIVKLAHESDGVIVSNDTYRDLQGERPEWKRCIEERLLMYSFVSDKFMPPDDPLGRHGPSLDNFLRKKPLVPEHKRQPCPYGKKCTYGVKCKFYHPERTHQSHRSLADELREKARLSSVKEGCVSNSSPRRGPQPDPGPLPSTLLDDLEHMSLGQHASPGDGYKGAEKKLQYWEGLGSSRNQYDHNHRASGRMPSVPSPPTAAEVPYASVSYDCLDSGFDSYESQSQYSDTSRGKSFRHSQQQQGFSCDSRHPDVHPERQPPDSPQACRCCFQQQQHHHGNSQHPSLSQSQPRVGWGRGIPTRISTPRSTGRIPSTARSPRPGRPVASPAAPSIIIIIIPRLIPTWAPLTGTQQSWAQPPPPACDPEREELRKNLQAIFNPRQVDTVMGMFPHLMDAQKLAAEILNLKSQGVSF